VQDSENLQARMRNMEAELTALREELSTRSKKGTSGAKPPTKIVLNGEASSATNHINPSVIKKTE